MGAAGGQISGGQKQRVAIARAFIKDPRILIFDEATSALDKKNEAEVQSSIDAIRKELGAVTTVVIAHRLTTIRNADQIIVLKKGVLTEIGNHDTLLRDYPDGVYAKLVKQQEDAENNGGEEVNSGSDNEDGGDQKGKGDDVDDIGIENFANQISGKVSLKEIEVLDAVVAPELQKRRSTHTNKQPHQTAKPHDEKDKKSHMSPEELKKKEETDKNDLIEDNKIEEFKKQLEKEGFMSRLKPYTKPVINTVIGVIVSVLQGAIFPVFGLFITKMLFSLFIFWDKDLLRSESDKWCLGMFLLCIGSFITGFTQKFMFGVVGENITFAMR